MNVLKELTTVMSMQTATTRMEATLARVNLVIVGMEPLAQVSYIYAYSYSNHYMAQEAS